MQTVDKDSLNPWLGALDDDDHNSEQNAHHDGSEPLAKSQTRPSATAPLSQPSGSPPVASPNTPVTNETSPPAQVPREREGPVDPQVASLRAMFPDFDDAVLQYVLESVQGDQDRAIDMLLGMNDPSYVSTEQPQAPPVSSQTDLDEQLARRLMLEEEQVHHAHWQAQQQQQRQQRTPRYESVPYEARVHQQPSGGFAIDEKDTMTEIQEQLSKIAESGKKTIGNIISKVKAKMQEFDTPKPQGSSSGGTEPRWGSGATGGNSYQYESAQQYSFYDPNLPASPPVQGYDATPYQSTPPSTNTQPLPILEPTARSVSPAVTTGDTPRSPKIGGGNPSANIDPGKLGLLPKRPVSLLQQSPPTEAVPQAHDDDDDDLEYAENPFEDGHK